MTLATKSGVNAAQNRRHLQFELNASNDAQQALVRGRQTARMSDAMHIGLAGLRAGFVLELRSTRGPVEVLVIDSAVLPDPD